LYQNDHGDILDINRKFTELFGYTPEEVKGKNINEGMIFPEENTVPESEWLTRKSLDGEDIKFETIRKKKDGTLVPVLITVSDAVTKDDKKAIIAFYQDISKEKEYLEKLQQSERKYRDLFENMPVVYYQTDKDGNLLMMNPTGIQLLGFQTLDDIIGKNIAQNFYYKPDDRTRFLEVLKDGGGQVEVYEVVLKNREGIPIPVFTNSRHYYDETGEIAGIEGLFMDITKRKRTEEALMKSQQEFFSIFQSNTEALAYLDERGNILDINRRFTELFGFKLEEIKGKNVNYGVIVPPDKVDEGEELDKRTLSRDFSQFETVRQKKDGTLFPVSISSSSIFIDEKIGGIIATYIDITERKKMEEQLHKMARIDSLTGCFNRGYGLELLERQIRLAKRNNSPLLIAFLDINHLKQINDRFGHQEGDRAIKMVGNLFKSTLREVDIICRMGGDEFLIAFPDNSMQQAPHIRERLEEELLSLNKMIIKRYQIKFSIGFSDYSYLEPKSVDELITIADQRMYEEKKKKN
jgi:diguanylate cyclase (GGDEF)-like protein/PAS domain S-box-containing protein